MKNEINGNFPLVSVYTCVYNMADKIHRALDSVKAQTYTNIEHIIVNDGSTDGVEKIIDEYKKNVGYPVIYIAKENGGKHTANNICWSHLSGEWAITVDADDALKPNAISFLMDQVNRIPSDLRSDYWCILGRCETQYGDFIGSIYPDNINELPREEAEQRSSKVSGEKIGLQYVPYLKQYRFPEPKYVKMVTEGVVWKQINKKYRTWYTNEICRVYYIGEGGNLCARSTNPQVFANNAFASRWFVQHRKEYPCQYVKELMKYSVWYNLATENYKREYKYFSEYFWNDKVLLLLAYIPAKLIGKIYVYTVRKQSSIARSKNL